MVDNIDDIDTEILKEFKDPKEFAAWMARGWQIAEKAKESDKEW